MKYYFSRLKILPGLAVFIAAFAVGILAVFYNSPSGPKIEVTAIGVKYIDLVEGQGTRPRPGQRVVVHYKGSLENGQEFENSYQRGTPASFQLGPGLIKGFEEGVLTMKTGGKRRLIIPPRLAYGAEGNPPKIPSNATLIFEVELLAVEDSHSQPSLRHHF